MPFEKLTEEKRQLVLEAHPRALFLASPETDRPDLALRPLSGTETRALTRKVRKLAPSADFADFTADAAEELLGGLAVWPDSGAKLLEDDGELYQAAYRAALALVTRVLEVHYPKDPSWPLLLGASNSSGEPSETSASPQTATSTSTPESAQTSPG